MIVPDIIGGANRICHIIFNSRHVKTGNTKHWAGGKPIQEFYALAICKYADEDSYYLFYCDSNWNAVADTNHKTIDDAKSQAEFEFAGTSSDWVDKPV